MRPAAATRRAAALYDVTMAGATGPRRIIVSSPCPSGSTVSADTRMTTGRRNRPSALRSARQGRRVIASARAPTTCQDTGRWCGARAADTSSPARSAGTRVAGNAAPTCTRASSACTSTPAGASSALRRSPHASRPRMLAIRARCSNRNSGSNARPGPRLLALRAPGKRSTISSNSGAHAVSRAPWRHGLAEGTSVCARWR
jgi:hypothetical protein